MNSREYRQWRQRRRAAWIEVNRKRKHPDVEAERLIEFASMWAPYGGPPDEELLVHFGMTTRRFIERLWQVIPESNCVPDEIRSLASAYPHHRRTSGSSPIPEAPRRSVTWPAKAADVPTGPKNLRKKSE